MGGVLYGLFFTSLFQIQQVDVLGEADTLSEQSTINTYFQAYLGKNLLLFNSKEHEEKLMLEYAYLKTLDIDRHFLHTVRVSLETYPSIATVRVDFEDGNKQFYVINERGYVNAVGQTDLTLPLIVMDVTGTELTEINQELIPQETLELLLQTSKDFEAKFNMQILEIYYLKRARELHLYTERNFFVWIDLTQELSLQLAKLKKALTELNIYEAPLEYVDLRISGQNGEKVIYKLSTP